MAKTSPGEFVRQVRQEVNKVTWPSRKETVQSTIMVLVMITIIALFLLGVDQVIAFLLQQILALGGRL